MPDMQRLDRGDGLSLAYREQGSGDPPMVFMHGMGGKSDYFSEQLRYFSRDHRVVLFDQRGRGQSSSPDHGYEIENLAEDARWLCEQLGLTRPVLVGHSLGGATVAALASRHPELPYAVVILDSGFDRPARVHERLSTFYDDLTEESYGEVMAAFVRERLVDAGDDPAVVDSILESFPTCSREVFLALGRAVLAFDMREACMGITAPTLFVGSSRPFCDLGVIHETRPDWYLGRTVGAGHFHHVLAAEQVNAMIRQFLGQVAAGYPSAQPSDY